MTSGADLLERLLARVADRSDPRACWEWTGAYNLGRKGQYSGHRRPVVSVGGKIRYVARVVCTLAHGEPPTPEHEAGHTCPEGENHKCINPQHLQWMTREENEQYKHGPSAHARREVAGQEALPDWVRDMEES